jgi:hypothetical protein
MEIWRKKETEEGKEILGNCRLFSFHYSGFQPSGQNVIIKINHFFPVALQPNFGPWPPT